MAGQQRSSDPRNRISTCTLVDCVLESVSNSDVDTQRWPDAAGREMFFDRILVSL